MNDALSHIIRRLAGDIVESRMRAREEGQPPPPPPEDLSERLSSVGFDASPTTAESFFDICLERLSEPI